MRLAAAVAVLSVAAVREARIVSAFSTDDIWWQLRTGAWVLQNHAVPRTGLFSQFPGLQWTAFGWPYALCLAAAYGLLGLRAVPLLLMAFKVALAAVTFLLAGGRRYNFWSAMLLSSVAQFVLINLQPLPVLFSICFFGVAVYLLIECRRRSEIKPLFWMPLLFWVWANLDAQFVLGLLLLCTFLFAETIERVLFVLGAWHSDSRPIPVSHLLAIAAACVAATFCTPYTTHLLPAAVQSAYSNTLFQNFASMSAMNFRQPEHFLLLLLFLAACLGLGLQRSRDLFKILLLTFCAMLAFRVQRDSWCVVLPSVAVLAGAIGSRKHAYSEAALASTYKEERRIASLVAIVLVVSFLLLPANQLLQARLDRVLPAKACDYIRSHHLPGPIFNEYQWGGYLIWKLPEYPVAIDERLNLYGDQMAETYFAVVMAKQRMEKFPNFARAQTIILPVNFAMTKALTTLPALQAQFHEAYRDDIAVVLVRR